MSVLFGVLEKKIVNYIGLRNKNTLRLDDYSLNISRHKMKECVMYDEIEQIILKTYHSRIKFYTIDELEVLKQRHCWIIEPENIRNDWNKNISFEKRN